MFCIRARVAVGLKKSLIKPRDFARAMSMLVEKVSFASENAKGECPAVFIKGKDSGSTRGLVVLQEWWGMNQQIQDEAKDIAKRGDFLAMVPDLYRGKVATDHETAGHYMSDLDWQGAVHDISGTKLTVYSTSTISYLGIPTPGWKTCTSLVKHCCDGVTTSWAFIVGDVIFVRFWVMVCIPVGIVYCDDPQQMPVK